MKVFNWIGFSILILFALVLIVAAFAPSRVEMKASATINAPDSVVFGMVNNLHAWEQWSPFAEGDSTMENQFHGPDAGVGAQMFWTSKKQGDGMMIITRSEPYRRIVFALDFMKNGQASSEWIFEKQGEGVKVTWSTTVEGLSYPMGRIMGLFMNGMMQDSYERGFKNISSICEEGM